MEGKRTGSGTREEVVEMIRTDGKRKEKKSGRADGRREGGREEDGWVFR